MAFETEPLPNDDDTSASAADANIEVSAAAAAAASFSTPTSTRTIGQSRVAGSATVATSRRTSMPEMEQSHRRASIQQIMRDSGLSQIEKQRSIQFLMDGRKLLQRRVTVECGSSSFGGGRGGSLVESMIGSNINSHDFAASATSAAAAAFERRNAMGGESGDEDCDSDDDGNKSKLRRRRRSSSLDYGKSNVPDYDAITAAAIAHAKSQTASDLFASQHPYKATTTMVPAIAAEASESALLASRQTQKQLQQNQHGYSSIDYARNSIAMAPTCTHYQRNCHIVSPCCGATFACRICHDDFPVLPPPLLLAAGGCNSSTNNNNPQHQRMLRTASMPVSFANSSADDGHHTLPRYAIKEIICRQCFTKQGSKT